ncbi:MAG: 3-oxoacyl-[acyl-carrier-protein] synthase 3 [Pseudomonas citronellolis]|nr:MAG: 3-oxoacyl-[acyl-carrier-protein] synthase 3 [Pseudomonas citronellolis]
MLGIKAVASYIPEQYVDNIAQAQRFGETEAFVLGKIGAERLPYKAADQETSDLCVSAANALFAQYPEARQVRFDALVVVTQNGDGEGLPHTAAIVQSKLGLPTHMAAFDVSLGCSGYVYGLHVLKGFLQATGGRNGLLFTADPYSRIVNRDDRNTAMLFGDAASVTWMGNDPVWQIGPASFGTDGSGAEYLRTENGLLHMNGRQIFNFASSKVPGDIRNLLKSAGLQSSDIDAYLLHQGSAAIVEAIARRFPEEKDRFLLDMRQTGNTVSSTLPLLLEKNGNAEWQHVVLCGFGVGLSWATTLLNRAPGKAAGPTYSGVTHD